ncbi:MAG: hypothetical protein Q8936_11750 [Bacillota bacterium]|nr:hypothetical protein [Bacillota bacterium]
MQLVWNLCQGNKEVKVVLIYNTYIRKKDLYINNDKVSYVKKKGSKNEFSFKYLNSEYVVELNPEGYGYSAYLTTQDGARIPNESEIKTYNGTPLWILPFVLINISIPVLSVEAVFPWLISLISSYMTAKISQRKNISLKLRIAASVVISILAWIIYYANYIESKSIGIKGGFLPFIK